MEYGIDLGGQAVGTATVYREGLYWVIVCRCRFAGEGIYRISVQCGEKTEVLGIPVPEDGCFALRTKVPVKRLGEGEMRFSAVPKYEMPRGKFIPLCPEEPFRYLKRLEHAYLEIRNGQAGVVIREDQGNTV